MAKDLVLVWRCKVSTGWQRFPALASKNGRLKHGYVMVNGHEEHHPDGSYYIRSYEGSLTKYHAAGTDPADAMFLLAQANRKRAAIQGAIEAGGPLASEPNRRPLGAAIALFVADRRSQGKIETAQVAAQALGSFEQSCGCDYLEDVRREHIYKWFEALRKDAGNGDRTLANKHTQLAAFWRHVGLEKDILPPKPRLEEEIPTIYEIEDTEKILALVDERLRLIMKVLDQTGMRERELMHMRMDAVSRNERTYWVRGQPKYKFKIKTYQQRFIPLSAALMDELAAWHKAHPHDLLFPAACGKPDGHILRTLKRAVRENGMNCGKCEGCSGPDQECSEWTLHKWRRSYITRLLREGFDLRSVMMLAGHKNMTATMRYLRPCSAAELQDRFNKIRWAGSTLAQAN